MARRRRRPSKSDSPIRSANITLIANRRLSTDFRSKSSPLAIVEDRRQYHPLEFFRPARTVYGTPHDPVVTKPQKSKKHNAFIAHQLSFPTPGKVALCVRRKQRKEVLHAINRVGKGRAKGKRRRNWYSRISC